METLESVIARRINWRIQFATARQIFLLRVNSNLYRGIRVSGFDGFRGCSIFSGIYHSKTNKLANKFCYGVATISRLLKMIGLFCRISSLL